MLGMHGSASANYAVDDCDLLIAVGARFDDRVAGVPPKFAPKAKRVLHFDIDPSEIHKVKTRRLAPRGPVARTRSTRSSPTAGARASAQTFAELAHGDRAS